MKITFILPAIGKKKGEKYIGTWKMEPLTIAVLKSLTPPDFETAFYDDRIELIDYEAKTDIVAITVETYTAKRSYFIAEQYKKHGAHVVMGGYHVTLCPDEAALHADTIITGNAESCFGKMLHDYKNGSLLKHYHGECAYESVLPDKSIFGKKNYLPVSLIETGRGCIHSCNFCAISSFYSCKYYKRDIGQITDDLEKSAYKYHFLVDDNLIADKQNARNIFNAITPYKIKWAGQGTLSMANDTHLLKSMKKSGCELILIGFESLENDSLNQMNKGFMTNQNRDELVKRIHDAGIGIYATFVLGYDGDTEKTIEKTVEFAKKHNFYTAAFNHLLPFPGTQLYKNLQNENRLIYDKWWLAEDYNYGELSFQPKNFTPDRLSELCFEARKEFSKTYTVLKRGMQAMGKSSPMMWSLFWAMNLRLGTEVSEKMNVPIGENLDEFPK